MIIIFRIEFILSCFNQITRQSETEIFVASFNFNDFFIISLE